MNIAPLKRYDVILVGAGLINLLEASYQTSLGREVLILERTQGVGGSWALVGIGGWLNVENAVHYLLPDRRAKKFLSKNLKVAISRNRPKYLVRVVDGELLSTASFNTWILKLLRVKQIWFKPNGFTKIRDIVNYLPQSTRQTWRTLSDRRWYPLLGSASLINRVLEIVEANGVNIMFGQEVQSVTIHPRVVVVSTNNNEWNSNKVILSHGLKAFPILIDFPKPKWFEFPNRGAFRPQALILLDDPAIERLAEFLVEGDDLVKYVHEVSGYAQAPSKTAWERQRILAVALKPDTSITERAPECLVERLELLGITSKECKVIEFESLDAFIPEIDHAVMHDLVVEGGGKIEILATENLAVALGNHGKRWKKTFRAAY